MAKRLATVTITHNDLLSLLPKEDPEETKEKQDQEVYNEEVHNSWCPSKLGLLFWFRVALFFCF